MTPLKALFRFLTNRWITKILYTGALVIFFGTGFSHTYWVRVLGTYIWYVGIALVIITTVILIKKKRWIGTVLLLIYSIVSTFGAGLIFSILSTMLTMIDGDHWADDLKLPENFELLEPIEEYPRLKEKKDSIRSVEKEHVDFVLYDYFQPGIYQADVWYKGKAGRLYFKAFEITQEYSLSTSRLEVASSFVSKETKELKLYKEVCSFKIYEGDWGKYYGARFELWIEYSDTKEKQKLLEKNYKIQGWMH